MAIHTKYWAGIIDSWFSRVSDEDRSYHLPFRNLSLKMQRMEPETFNMQSHSLSLEIVITAGWKSKMKKQLQIKVSFLFFLLLLQVKHPKPRGDTTDANSTIPHRCNTREVAHMTDQCEVACHTPILPKQKWNYQNVCLVSAAEFCKLQEAWFSKAKRSDSQHMHTHTHIHMCTHSHISLTYPPYTYLL